MALWIWSLPLLLKFSGRETMLSFCLANLFALRQEVTANLIQISIEEDTIDQPQEYFYRIFDVKFLLGDSVSSGVMSNMSLSDAYFIATFFMLSFIGLS